MPTKVSHEESQQLARLQQVVDFAERGIKTTRVARSKKRLNPIEKPADRSTLRLTWRGISDRQVDEHEEDASRVIDPKTASVKLEKASDYIGTYHGHNGVLRPEYDMLEPFVIFDTEGFVKQAISRKLSLMFRNGFEVLSDLDQHVDYINRRLDTLEYVMNRPTENFFTEILYNLLLCSNCFLRKIRDAKATTGVKQEANGNKVPVAGYTIIPAHSIMPYLKKGVIIKWRRYYETGMPYEDIGIDDIVHLKWDVKPGHIFGTPRTVGVRDDIFALRRLEENIELLFINHLFPLFHVAVGSEKAPCTYGPDGSSEIDLIRYQIETMPKEGVFVTDERVKVEAVGAKGETLDTENLIAHLKGRVYTGLGVSPIDMGEGDTANRATADNISQNLKDSIKKDLETFAGLIRIHLFKEWFQEANYSLSVQKAVAMTTLAFHEIDLDNLIKEQNHVTQLWLNNLISHEEARKWLRRKPMTAKEWKDTYFEKVEWPVIKRETELQHEQAKELAEHQTELEKQLLTHQTQEGAKQAETTMSLNQSQMKLNASEATLHTTKAAAQTKVLKARTAHALATGSTVPKKSSTPKKKRATQNRETPTNQHGRAAGPTKAKSSREYFQGFRDRLQRALEVAIVGEAVGPVSKAANWAATSRQLVDEALVDLEPSEISDSATDSYTSKVRTGLERLKDAIAQTPDPEILSMLLDGIEELDQQLVIEGEDVETEVESAAEGSPDGDPAGSSAGPSDSEPQSADTEE